MELGKGRNYKPFPNEEIKGASFNIHDNNLTSFGRSINNLPLALKHPIPGNYLLT
jgi:hypothetical protein